MNIRYRSIPDLTRAEGFSRVPLLQVSMRHGVRVRPFLALVDSGAVDCIFPESLGTVLGIDVPSGQPRNFYGLANQEAQGFMHAVELQVTGFDHWIGIEVGFVVGGDVPPLLGQSGFFDHYQIVFERFRRTFEVNTKTDALIRNRRGHGRGRHHSRNKR